MQVLFICEIKTVKGLVYRDELGDPVRKAEKYEDGSWRQFRWNEGNWIAGTKGVRDIPYQLSELLEDY